MASGKLGKTVRASELERKPVDFKAVASRIQSVISTIQKHDSVERFCGLGAKVEFGQAMFVDEHSIKLNGKIYSAKTWVIATGSSPSIPSIQGLDKTPFLTNREIFSLDHLPCSMIFLGEVLYPPRWPRRSAVWEAG